MLSKTESNRKVAPGGTNLPFKQWTTIFPGAACVVAIVDRFVQHCHVMDIDGESWRPQDSEPPPKRARKR